MRKLLFVGLIASICTISSCKRNDGTIVEFDSPKPEMEYKSPINMVVRFSNDAAKVEFVKIRVYRKANPTSLLYNYNKEINTKEHAIGEQFEVDVTQKTELILEYETGQKIQVKGAHKFYVIP